MKRRTLSSWVWQHCTRSQDGNEATCNLCNDVLQIRGSTSSLIKHLNTIHSLGGNHKEDEAQKRRHLDTFNDDNAMDLEIPNLTVDSMTIPSNSVSCPDQFGIQKSMELDSSADASNLSSISFSRPSTSVDTISVLSTARAPVVEETANDVQGSRVFSQFSRTTVSRGRIRCVENGARPDRPCNKDRIELITQVLTKMIINDMLPLSFVENSGFRDFMTVVEPNYQVPCAKTIKSRIVHAYEEVSAKVSARLANVPSIAWTSDCWSSRNQASYMSVTAHFLDLDWVPNNYTLSTEELSERHTAENLTNKLQSVMTHWQLDGKVIAVVTDNAAAAKSSVRNLDNILVNAGVTCAAHSLQLCVTHALKHADGAALCTKASKVVAHFRHSNIATAALEAMQEQLGLKKLKLIQCCVTRWGSTFAMVDRLLTNRRAVINVLADRAVTKPEVAQRLEIAEGDWIGFEKLQKILMPLKVATTVLCSDSYSPTSMVRPIVFMLRNNHLSDSPEDEGSTMISEMKATLRKQLTDRFDLAYDCIIGVNARQVASFLDPRYKDLLVEPESSRGDIRSFVRGLIVEKSVDEQEDESQSTAMDFLFQTVSKSNSSETQFAMYLSEPQISHNMNPFEWWANREKRYPTLAELVRKYLCIPASSASSERVFSTAGNVVSSKRNDLLPENVNMLVFLYQNRKLLQSKR